jgi:formamidopyrimidine-DNA glycosylase
MPELPEVEIVRRNLTAWLEGRAINNVSLSGRHRGVQDARRWISKCRVEAVSRWGKYLILDLGSQSMVIHLGMSGRLLAHSDQNSCETSQHDHVIVTTDEQTTVVFQDHRRFGRVFLSPKDLSALPSLGPDAQQIGAAPSLLDKALSGRRGLLKPALMDQAIIAGIGNIYACEILWAARLMPRRRVESLLAENYEALALSITDVLVRAIAAGGATLDDYRGTSGEMGNFNLDFSAYAREGEACRRCRFRIATERLLGRITYWCPKCQS